MLRRLQVGIRLLTIVASAAASAVVLITGVAAGRYALAAAVLIAMLLRLQARTAWWRHVGAAGLVVSLAALAGVLGGPGDVLVVAVVLSIADYGWQRPVRLVALTGVVAAITLVAVGAMVGQVDIDGVGWIWIVPLLPLVGVITGQLGGRETLEGTAILESATVALDEVIDLAEKLPSGIDRWSVATAVQLELRQVSRIDGSRGPQPHLLVVQEGVLLGVGSPVARRPVGFLSDIPSQRFARSWARVDGAQLPQTLTDAIGDSRWHVHHLNPDDPCGVVLVPHDVDRSALDAISESLRPAAVALANVDRFERLQEMAISAARTRVAHDLHDGVAQALTHVRLELDMLMLEHEGLVDEIGRIRGAADAALLEVRRMVGELRDTSPLGERIREHVELLSSFAPLDVELELPASLVVPDEAADDVFRIVQEALSNVVRHAGANFARVSLSQDDQGMAITVVDDGVGTMGASRGVGLDAMTSRAERLGGRFTIRSRHGGGTVVDVHVPLPGPASTSRAAEQVGRSG